MSFKENLASEQPKSAPKRPEVKMKKPEEEIRASKDYFNLLGTYRDWIGSIKNFTSLLESFEKDRPAIWEAAKQLIADIESGKAGAPKAYPTDPAVRADFEKSAEAILDWSKLTADPQTAFELGGPGAIKRESSDEEITASNQYEKLSAVGKIISGNVFRRFLEDIVRDTLNSLEARDKSLRDVALYLLEEAEKEEKENPTGLYRQEDEGQLFANN